MTEAERQVARKAGKKADAIKQVTPEMLVNEHASAVLGLCITYVKNFHDGEDIMQDVFLKAFTKIDTLRDHTRARQWLCRIAKRKCIDHLRKHRPGRPINDAGEMVARSNIYDEKSMQIHNAVSKLPEGYRETISLYYLDGCDCAGVAKSLGISNAAVRRRLTRARLMLHELLVEDKS